MDIESGQEHQCFHKQPHHIQPFSTKPTCPQLSKTWPPATCWLYRCSLCRCDDRICSLAATKPCLWWIGRGRSAGCLERSVGCLEGSRCLERLVNPEGLKGYTRQILFQICLNLITTTGGGPLSLPRSQRGGPRIAGLDIEVST